MIVPTHLQLDSSPTMEINALALKKKAAGERIFNLCAGEPIIPTPDVIKKAAIDTLETNQTHYPPVAGLSELRARVAEWIGGGYTQENVIVTPGAKFGIYLLCHMFLQAGDDVLVISPYYTSYPSIAKLFGASVNTIDTEDILQIETAITPQTKLLFLNNGTNPTGELYDTKTVKHILDVCKKHNVFVISDEVYSELVYEGEYVSCAQFEEYRNNIAILQSCSKSLSMTGWRIGFVCAPQEIVSVVKDLMGQSMSGVNTLAQYGALKGFEYIQELSAYIKRTMQQRRDVFVDTFNTLFGTDIKKPASALYVFIPLNAFGIPDLSSEQFCKDVLEHTGVVMVPGTAFGREGYVRCAFGAEEEELKEGLQRVHKYLHNA